MFIVEQKILEKNLELFTEFFWFKTLQKSYFVQKHCFDSSLQITSRTQSAWHNENVSL